MSQLDDAEAIAAAAGDMRAQARRAIRRVLDPHATATALFRGPDGKLRDSAVEWLHTLGRECFADETTFDPDPRIHAYHEGARAVFLRIMASLQLDTRRLAALRKDLREADDE